MTVKAEEGTLPKTDWDEEEFTGEIVRLNGAILGLVLGLMAGVIVFLATNLLVVQGGEPLGPHLALLGEFFYGYSVSFVGSLIGSAYAFVLGYLAGWSTARTYNWIVAFRNR